MAKSFRTVFGLGRKGAGMLLTAGALVGGASMYLAHEKRSNSTLVWPSLVRPGVAYAGSQPPASQPSVFSETKQHALYLWIHLKPSADVKACVKATAGLQSLVDKVTPPSDRDETDEIFAGVAYGPAVYTAVFGKPKQPFDYVHRSGAVGDLPATGGDIFIHAKSNNVSKLFELAQQVLARLPAGAVARFDDRYGFVYRNGRDMTGFIDGTENPASEDHRRSVAVEAATGGSYLITQRWVHLHDVIANTSAGQKEGFIGRTLDDSVELKRKPDTSHLARMTGGSGFEQKKVFEIVRQSQPYGRLADDSGLFFIAYARTPEAFNFMLDRMVGKAPDGLCDHVMKLTKCVSGNYWYVPSAAELKRFV